MRAAQFLAVGIDGRATLPAFGFSIHCPGHPFFATTKHSGVHHKVPWFEPAIAADRMKLMVMRMLLMMVMLMMISIMLRMADRYLLRTSMMMIRTVSIMMMVHFYPLTTFIRRHLPSNQLKFQQAFEVGMRA